MRKQYASRSGEFASAADEESSYPVLRVFRMANFALTPPGRKGYYPAATVNVAAAHRWVSYRIFISFLRRLVEGEFNMFQESREAIYFLGKELPVPFAVSHRFPDEEVYVCVDRAPVGSLMVRLLGAVDARASREYYDVVSQMMDMVTVEDSTLSKGLPVLYNRCIFESVFQLQWRD